MAVKYLVIREDEEHLGEAASLAEAKELADRITARRRERLADLRGYSQARVLSAMALRIVRQEYDGVHTKTRIVGRRAGVR